MSQDELLDIIEESGKVVEIVTKSYTKGYRYQR